MNVTKLWAELWDNMLGNSAASWTSINFNGTVFASKKDDASSDRSRYLRNTNIK